MVRLLRAGISVPCDWGRMRELLHCVARADGE
jgi:hypothetical protein